MENLIIREVLSDRNENKKIRIVSVARFRSHLPESETKLSRRCICMWERPKNLHETNYLPEKSEKNTNKKENAPTIVELSHA